MDSRNVGCSVGFLEMIGVVVITAKIFGVIDWPWSIILIPVWLPFVVLFILGLIATVVQIFVWIGKKIKR
jgi:hypothetical protein